MLKQVGGNDDIAEVQGRIGSAGDADKENAVDPVVLEKNCGRRRRGNLAPTGEHDDDIDAAPCPLEIVAAGDAAHPRCSKLLDNPGNLFRHGSHDPDLHPATVSWLV